MNRIHALIAAAAAATSFGALADEYTGYMSPQETRSERSRDEVRSQLAAGRQERRQIVAERDPYAPDTTTMGAGSSRSGPREARVPVRPADRRGPMDSTYLPD